MLACQLIGVESIHRSRQLIFPFAAAVIAIGMTAAMLASPIQISGTRYEMTQSLTIRLDPKTVLR